MVSQEKWDKTKRLIHELVDMVTCDHLALERLLQIRGFLMYVVRTYTWINPYMKGLHLTIDTGGRSGGRTVTSSGARSWISRWHGEWRRTYPAGDPRRTWGRQEHARHLWAGDGMRNHHSR